MSGGSSLNVTGGGNDVWSKADAFQFVYESVTGDVTITAKLKSVTTTNQWTKAMLMMRDGTTAGARNAAVLGTPTPANSYRYQVRSLAGGDTTSFFAGPGTLPRWLRLVRTGDTFTGSYSSDGVTWQLINSASIPSTPATMLVGLGVTGHTTTNALATAQFDFISVTQP
jgi:hypothetical protein